MPARSEDRTVADLLQTLQVQVLAAHYTKCTASWRDVDYTPEYNKLYFIQEGDGWLRIGDQQLYPKAGELCLMPAYTKQSYSTVSEHTYGKYWCHFTAMVGPVDLFQWIGVPLSIQVENLEEMAGLFEELRNHYRNASSLARLREKAILLEIIARYLESVPIRVLQHRSEDIERMKLIQHYINEHLSASMRIEDLAKELHLHPNYFIAYFKKNFGISPLRYVSRKRAEKAKMLLATTSMSIKDIADQTGFKDTNHFAKFFRKETSYTPTEYRSTFHT